MTDTVEPFAQRVLEAENGNPDAIRALLSRAPTWHTPPSNLVGGAHMGAEQIVANLAAQRALTDGTFHVEAKGALDQRGDVATLHVRAFAQRGTMRLEADAYLAFRVKDGHIEEAWTRPRDEAAWDRFWSA